MSHTGTVDSICTHSYFSVGSAAVRAVGFGWCSERAVFVDVLFEYYSWVTYAVASACAVDSVKVLNCLILNRKHVLFR